VKVSSAALLLEDVTDFSYTCLHVCCSRHVKKNLELCAVNITKDDVINTFLNMRYNIYFTQSSMSSGGQPRVQLCVLRHLT
jgi:hypothetical protein